MAAALAEALGGPPPVITGKYRLADVRHIVADSSRLRAELGWRVQNGICGRHERTGNLVRPMTVRGFRSPPGHPCVE